MRTTTSLCLVLAFMFFRPAFAQTSVQEQIDNQVWKPFEQTYAALDAEGFLAIHAPDAIRVARDAKHINSGRSFNEEVLKNVAAYQQRGGRRTIELRFTERFNQGNLAFDSGYYKVVTTFDEGESYTFYGQFDVILRQIDGRWKIQVDADSSHGGTLNEQDFLKGKKVGEY